MKKGEIIAKLNAKRKFNDLYTFGPVKTSQSKIVAEWLCSDNNLAKFATGIDPITRKEPYAVDHNTKNRKSSSNRIEERIAIYMATNHINLGTFGTVVDYQIPLKDSQKDKGVGKIDLISYNEKTNELFVLELKKPESNESLLRCCLEAYTYSKIVNKDKLIKDYRSAGHILCSIRTDAKVIPCPLIFKESKAAAEYQSNNSNLKRIIEELGIKVAVISIATINA